jgi:hypothetical protein
MGKLAPAPPPARAPGGEVASKYALAKGAAPTLRAAPSREQPGTPRPPGKPGEKRGHEYARYLHSS